MSTPRIFNLLTRIKGVAVGFEEQKVKVTMETIEAVREDGRYTVRGVTLAPTGTKIYQLGEKVPVVWQTPAGATQPIPVAIFGHNWRRAQGVIPEEVEVLPGEYQNVETVTIFGGPEPIPIVKLVSTSQGDFALNLTDFVPEDEDDTFSSATLRKAVFCANNPTLVAVLWRSFIASPSAGIAEGGFGDPVFPRDEFSDTRWHFRVFKVSSGTKRGKIIKNIDEETGQATTIQFGPDTLTEIKPELVSSLDIAQAEITARRVTLRPTFRHNSLFQRIEIDLQNGLAGFCRADGSSSLTVDLAVDDQQEWIETFEDSVPFSPLFSGQFGPEFFWCLEEDGQPKIYTICLGDFLRRPNNENRSYGWFPPDGTISYIKEQHDNEGNYGNQQIGGIAGAGDFTTIDQYRRLATQAFFGDSPGLSFGVMDVGFPVRDVAQFALGGSLASEGEAAVYLINLSQAKTPLFDGEGIVFRNTEEVFLIEWENWRGGTRIVREFVAVGDPVASFGFITSTACVTTGEHDFTAAGIRFANTEQPWTIDPWKSEYEAFQGVNEISGVCNQDNRHIINLGTAGGCPGLITTILIPGTGPGELLDVPFGSQVSVVSSPPNPIITLQARLSLLEFPQRESFLGGTGPGTQIRPIFELRPNQLEGSISRGQQNRLVEWDGGNLTELGVELTEGFPGIPTVLMFTTQVNKRFVILDHNTKDPPDSFSIFDRRDNTIRVVSPTEIVRLDLFDILDEMGFTDERLFFLDNRGLGDISLKNFGLLRVRVDEDLPTLLNLVTTKELIIRAQPSNVFKQQRGETSAIFPISLEEGPA